MSLQERDWLNHCDLIKLKERCAAVKTTAPIPETTTKKGAFFWWWKSQKNVGFRPMAHEKEILESLKQKLISDSYVSSLSKIYNIERGPDISCFNSFSLLTSHSYLQFISYLTH